MSGNDAEVTQADRDIAAPFASCLSDMQDIFDGKADLLPIVQAFARHRQQAIAQHEGERGEPVAWQRRQLYSDIPGYVPQWQFVSKEEATSHFDKRPGYEYRPLYAHPPATRPAALAEDEVEALVERLREGVHSDGLHEDNNTELFDIEDADEVMHEAASLITQQAEEVAWLRPKWQRMETAPTGGYIIVGGEGEDGWTMMRVLHEQGHDPNSWCLGYDDCGDPFFATHWCDDVLGTPRAALNEQPGGEGGDA